MKRFWAALLIVCVFAQPLRADDPPPQAKSADQAPAPIRSLSSDTPEGRAKLANAQKLFATISELLKQQKFKEAIPVGTQLVKECRQIWGEESVETALAIHQLGASYSKAGDYENARKCQVRVLAIRRQVLGNEHEHTALALRNLAATLGHMQKPSEALALEREALAIHQAKFGERHPLTAESYFGLGSTLTSTGDYAAARTCFEKALAINTEVLGSEHPYTVGCRRHLGSALAQLKEFQAARACLEAASANDLVTYGEHSKGYAAGLTILADVLVEMGNHAEALPQLQKALAIHLEQPDQSTRDIAHLRRRVARCLTEVGNFSQAREQFEQALAAFRTTNEDPATISSVLSELGSTALRVSDLPAARSYFEQSLAVSSAAPGDQLVETFSAQVNLAATLVSMRDYTAARSHFEKAVAVEKKLAGKSDVDTSGLYQELGTFMRSTGNLRAARACLEKALAVRRKLYGKHRKTANTVESLGSVCAAEGDFAAAQKHIEDALAMRRASLPEGHPFLAHGYNDLGYVLGMQGKYAEALDNLKQSLEIGKRQPADSEQRSYILYSNLALFSAANDQWLAAARYEDQSRRHLRRHVDSVLCELPERVQLDFLNHDDRFCLFIGTSLALHGRTDPAIAALSAGWIINNKGLAQEVLAERAVRARESDDPKIAAIMKQLGQVRAQQAQLTVSGAGAAADGTRMSKLTSLAHTEEDLSRQLARAGSRSVQAERWIELDQVRKQLAGDEVYIDILNFPVRNFDLQRTGGRWMDDHYAAWIIPPAGKGDVTLIDLGTGKAINLAVGGLRKAITDIYNIDEKTGRIKPIDPQARKLFVAAFLRLSTLVLHPVIKEIGPAKKLIISPDSGLWLVPWAALLLPDGRFAVEEYQIAHVVSGRELIPPATSLKPGRSMIVADPNFDLPPAEVASISKAVLSGQKLADAVRPAAARAKPPSAIGLPLPIFARQAEMVAPKLTTYVGKRPAILQGDRALEALVKAVHRPRVALFATHGFFEPERPMTEAERAVVEQTLGMSDARRARTVAPDNPLLRCGVLLAGCNWRDSSSGDDGILTGMEILGIDLRGTEMVVLSACDTAMGDVQIGEGVGGVRQAFQLAGAQTVVSTLWPVGVQEATDQMNAFFTYLAAGQGKAEALRNAQLASIKRLREEIKFAHPLTWAPFTITGQRR